MFIKIYKNKSYNSSIVLNNNILNFNVFFLNFSPYFKTNVIRI